MTHEQPDKLERVARFLDGESIDLSDDERALADDVRSAQRDLDAAWPAPALPPRAANAAMERVNEALATPRRRPRVIRLSWRHLGAMAMTAAAVVLLAVGLRSPGPTAPRATETPHSAELVQTIPPPDDLLAMDEWSEQRDQLEADLLTATSDDWVPPLPADASADDLDALFDDRWPGPAAGEGDDDTQGRTVHPSTPETWVRGQTPLPTDRPEVLPC
jgi:hypothetical protein